MIQGRSTPKSYKLVYYQTEGSWSHALIVLRCPHLSRMSRTTATLGTLDTMQTSVRKPRDDGTISPYTLQIVSQKVCPKELINAF